MTKYRFEASAVSAILMLIMYFPNRPIQPKRDFEKLKMKTCHSKSCSVVTKLF